MSNALRKQCKPIVVQHATIVIYKVRQFFLQKKKCGSFYFNYIFDFLEVKSIYF